MNRKEIYNPPKVYPKALKISLDGFLLFSFLFISMGVLRDYYSGGDEWKQGDWLVNNFNGNVRRGILGSALIYISDTLGSNPLVVVVTIQIILLFVLFTSFRMLSLSTPHEVISVIILISPAIFTVFWAADLKGSMRKEIFPFIGLSLCALSVIRKNWLFYWVGVFSLCIGLLAHEAMILFIPAFLLIVILSGISKTAIAHTFYSCVTVLFFGILSIIYTIGNLHAADPHLICSPLLERGLNSGICDGSIKWIGFDSDFGILQVSIRMTRENIIPFATAYLFSLLPFLYLIYLTRNKLLNSLVLMLLALPFAPLYFIGVDWGRWISFHVFTLAVIAVVGLKYNRINLKSNPKMRSLLFLVSIPAIASPQHTIGILWGSVSRRLILEAWRFFL